MIDFNEGAFWWTWHAHPYPGAPEGIRIPRCAGCGCVLDWVLQQPDIKPDTLCLCGFCFLEEQAVEDYGSDVVRPSGRA